MTKTDSLPTKKAQIQVWDIGVRIFHWGMVSMFASAYFFADSRKLHVKLGYVVVALFAFRIIWGFVGGKHARFKDFMPRPIRLIRYLLDMLRGREARFIGHNPAGGAMILALLFTIISIGVTGHMIRMPAFFGVEWVETSHKVLVKISLLLIFAHISGVIFSSYRHRENLVKAMVTGLKDAE